MSLENKRIVIPEEIKNLFHQNKSKIDDKIDLDNFYANNKNIRVLFDFLDDPRVNYSNGPESFVSLKTMLEFSQNIVTNSGECLDDEIVENMFRVLQGSAWNAWVSEENNQGIDQTIGSESLELVKNVVKLKIKFCCDTLKSVAYFMSDIAHKNVQFDVTLIFDAINEICNNYTDNKQDLIASNLYCWFFLLKYLRGLFVFTCDQRGYEFDIPKILSLVQKVWDEFNENLGSDVIDEMFHLLNETFIWRCNELIEIEKEDVGAIFKLIEDVLKSKIKLDYRALDSIRDVIELLLETIAKDYLQEFDVKQIFAMLWDACVNTIDDVNDDYEVIEQKVNLVLCSLKKFIDALNEYHKAESEGVTAELVEYIWSQAKNAVYNETAPVRNREIVERIFFLLTETLRYKEIANFANENLKDVLSLAIRVLALDFWLESQLDRNVIENNLTVQNVLEALLELSQMGEEQSKQVNDKIEKFGLKIEDDTIVIADKNMFDGFYGDKSECISETINDANREHIKNKQQRDNEEIENDETNENKIGDEAEDPKIKNNNDQVDMNKTQPNSLRTEAKVDKEKVERTQEEEKVEDTKKLLIPIRKKQEKDNKPTYTNEQILEEIEKAYINNCDIGDGINPKQLSEAIKSSKKYYYYASMLSSKKYDEIKKDFSPGERLVIFFYWLIPFKLFTHPDKITINKQSISNGNKNKTFPPHQNIIEESATQDKTNYKMFDNSLQ